MATIERFGSFEEMDAAQLRDAKKDAKSASNRNLLQEFGKLLREGVQQKGQKKKRMR